MRITVYLFEINKKKKIRTKFTSPIYFICYLFSSPCYYSTDVWVKTPYPPNKPSSALMLSGTFHEVGWHVAMASGKALYSIAVVALGFICFVVGAIAVGLPTWGNFASCKYYLLIDLFWDMMTATCISTVCKG